MAQIIGVRFKNAGKVYYFDPGRETFETGEGVIVETTKGVEYGKVVIRNRELKACEEGRQIKPIVRRATEKDEKKLEDNRRREEEATPIFEEKVKKYGLEMKLTNVEYTFDGSKVIFYFTADGRVDFRELVKDLASVFKVRIELRQIGVRDETKMIGGLGPCGRPACCSAFLGDFQPVSIKMAKEQNLSLSPTKISGLCGRLMCCLNYEHKYYEEVCRRMPKTGAEVITPDGRGTIYSTNCLTETVKVRMELDGNDVELKEYGIDQVKQTGKGKKQKKGRQEKREEEPVLDEEMKKILQD